MTLEQAIKESGKSQKQIAKECQITEASLSRYVNCNRVPNVFKALRIARSIGVTVEYIWGNKNITIQQNSGFKFCPNCGLNLKSGVMISEN